MSMASLPPPRPLAFVLYGSETGNAQDLAEGMGRMMERLRFTTYVAHLNSIDLATLPANSLVAISISTTGQGDFPSNASVFWKGLLRKRLKASHLEHVAFTIFGLGDSSYPKYNYAARKLHKRLLQLGAFELYPRGEADEQHEDGSDATFVPWLENLCRQLMEAYPFQQGVGPIPDHVFLEPKWTLRLANSNFQSPKQLAKGSTDDNHATANKSVLDQAGTSVLSSIESSQDAIHKASSAPTNLPYGLEIPVSLVQNQRITPTSHFQDVRHLVFTTPQVFNYTPGDVMTISPQNPARDVQAMLDMMQWDRLADEPLYFHHTDLVSQSTLDQPPIPPSSLPSPSTLRTLLVNNLDINAIPRRPFFSTIAHFTTDETQKSRLQEFAAPELSEELHDYATRPRRSILETLHDFHTVRIPFQYAATVLPLLRGRQFSIASGGELLWKLPQTNHHNHPPDQASGSEATPDVSARSEEGTRIDVLMALVSYRTVLKRLRQGTCSRYISSLPVESELCVTLQRGSFGLKPSDITKPVLLVGPGTGLAPMRALIWQRKQWVEEFIKRQDMASSAYGVSETSALPTQDVGETALFFGARSRHADFFFQDEWTTLTRHETFPLRVLTTFSRDALEGQADLKADHAAVDSPSPLPNDPSSIATPALKADGATPSTPSNQVLVRAKPYVQSLIRAHPHLVYDILHHKGGKIFVSGSAGAMPRGVREAVVDVFAKMGAQEREDAEREVREMEQAGRWIVECW